MVKQENRVIAVTFYTDSMCALKGVSFWLLCQTTANFIARGASLPEDAGGVPPKRCVLTSTYQYTPFSPEATVGADTLKHET